MIFHHEGVVTQDLEEETKVYKTMGFEVESDFEDPIQKVRGRFLEKDGFRVELLEPISEDSPLTSYIKRNIKIYHHAFKTVNLENAIEHLMKNDFILLGQPEFSVAFAGKIAFLISPTMLLIELIET